MSKQVKERWPKVRLTDQLYAHRHVFEVRNMLNPPTYDQALIALEEAEEHLRKTGRTVAAQVRWKYTPGNWTAFCRCECGEIAFCGEVCQTCRLLASLLVESSTSGPLQVRFERAERAMARLAQIVDRLHREARGHAA